METYEATPVFIPVGIMEEVVELVMRKLSWSARPGGTDLEALQGCLLKFGDNSKKLYISVEYFVCLLSNQNPLWYSYQAFVSARPVALDKIPGVRLVGVVETWHRIFRNL